MTGIRGFLGVSLSDFPNRVSSVIFFSGCNFECPYCHNYILCKPVMYSKMKKLQVDDVVRKIEERANFLDGVVISGGEPTLSKKELIELIEKLKPLGLPIKLDTNGSNPEVVEEAIKAGVSFVSLDLKTIPQLYRKFTSLKKPFSKVLKTIEVCKKTGTFLHIRTTVYPPLVNEMKLRSLIKYYKEANLVSIQQYYPTPICRVDPYVPTVLEKLREILIEEGIKCD